MTPVATAKPTESRWFKPMLLLAWAGAVGLTALSLSTGAWAVALIIVGGLFLGAISVRWTFALLLVWVVTGPTVSDWLYLDLPKLPKITPDRVLLGALLAVFFARTCYHKVRLHLGGQEIAMIMFTMIALISMWLRGGARVGGSWQDVIFLSQGYLMPFLAFVLAKHMITDAGRYRALVSCLIGLGCYLTAMGLLQVFFGISVVPQSRFEGIHEGRATAGLANAVTFGVFVGGGLLAATSRLMSGEAKHRWWTLAATTLCFSGILFSKTRSVWLGVILGLVIFAYFERRVRRALLIAAPILLALGVSALVITGLADSFKDRLTHLAPIANRVVMAVTVSNMVQEHPFFGIGFGRYAFLVDKPKYMGTIDAVPIAMGANLTVPHNEFLHIFALTGLLGLTPMLLIFYFSWRDALRLWRLSPRTEPYHRHLALLSMGVMAMYIANMLLADLGIISYVSYVPYLMMGVAAGTCARLREQAPGSLSMKE